MGDDKNENTQLPLGNSSCSIVSGKSGRTQRVDAHGVVIEKGKKFHRATFVDDLHPGSPVEEVKLVAAHKGNGLGGYRDQQPGCACTVS
mmetsp:Transcript_669/g.2122  ORF Transcript_669/g.2122 Transcript_669/m.2122 type:complete len:89 (-) Transcript_669:242-508(-)